MAYFPLPDELVLTDAERVFISQSPSNLWPLNQNSNFGELRRVMCRQMQDGIDILEDLWTEIFVPTSDGYLGLHEFQVGLPKNPTDWTLLQRRTAVLFRKRKGAINRRRLKDMIEAYILTSTGEGSPPEFTPGGIEIPADGIPLYGEQGSAREFFWVVEAHNAVQGGEAVGYEIQVNVDPGRTPPEEALKRDIKWYLPAGIEFNYNAVAIPARDYYSAVVSHDELVTYIRFEDGVASHWDYSGHGVNYTEFSSPAYTTGLINAGGRSMVFDGVADYVELPSTGLLEFGFRSFTIEFWIRIASGTGDPKKIVTKGNPNTGIGWEFDFSGTDASYINAVFRMSDGTTLGSITINSVSRGVGHHIAVTFDADTKFLMAYMDGNPVGLQQPWAVLDYLGITDQSSKVRIGRDSGSVYGACTLDEFAVYLKALSPAEIMTNYLASGAT